MKLRRIDSELVRRGLAKSRSAAAQMVEEGRVKLDGQVVLKPARQMDPAQAIVVEESDDPEYVSRGAHKLAGALDALGEKAPLLRRGAASVVAVDVGYGQLAWKLQSDPRVEVHDRTNVRTLDPASVAPAPGLVVGDMSFISLTLVLPALVGAAAPDADFLLMVKPQFEIGKERLGHGGVVRNPEHHVETVDNVARCAMGLGLDIAAIAASPLPGPSGNVEYFLFMRRAYPDPIKADELTDYIRRAVAEGPAGRKS